MSGIAHHYVRRAIDVTQQHYSQASAQDGNQDEPQIKELALWGVLLLWGTFVLYSAMIAAVNYTYGEVVATLTMIETPTATAVKTTSTGDIDVKTEVDAPLLSSEETSEKQRLLTIEQDLFLVKQPPITSKLRTATKHLRSVAGPFARFRGLHVAIIQHLAHGFIVNMLTSHRHSYGLKHALVSVVASILLCRIQMTWTHIVISNPSTKRWYQRFPSWSSAKKIVVPTAVAAVAQNAAIILPLACMQIVVGNLALTNAGGNSPAAESAQKYALLQLFGILMIFLVSIVLVVIPAEATLKRVQASMLPEDHETIVPFDRSFGGKVVPEVLGGSGAVGMLDAWRTFDKEGRVRLVKVYMKVFAIQTVATVALVMTLVGELKLIMGTDFEKALEAVREQMRPN